MSHSKPRSEITPSISERPAVLDALNVIITAYASLYCLRQNHACRSPFGALWQAVAVAGHRRPEVFLSLLLSAQDRRFWNPQILCDTCHSPAGGASRRDSDPRLLHGGLAMSQRGGRVSSERHFSSGRPSAPRQTAEGPRSLSVTSSMFHFTRH